MPVTWFILCVAGFGMLAVYQNTAAPQSKLSLAVGMAASRSAGEMALDPAHTLYFFLHPECSCSRASLAEAEKVLLSLPDVSSVRLEAIVYTSPEVAYQEDGRFSGDLDWKITLDEEGAIASRFGIEASGHVVVADYQGQILFTGGVTASRGHRGANAHSVLLNEALNNVAPQKRAPIQTPVYGCAFFSN